MTTGTHTKFSIRRFQPETDDAPHWEDFEIETEPGMTILDGLRQIRQQIDGTLSMRFSCRMGICGSCAMVINGNPGLACNTQIHNVGATHVRLEPLWNFPVIKDLVPDLDPSFDHHRRLKPYIIRPDADELNQAERELKQTTGELLDYLQFTYCIKCCACVAACPTVAMNGSFMGPMPLAAAHRYNADSRDDGFDTRKSTAAENHGVSSCHYAGECARVCPKGVDPAKAIQLMKRDLIMDLFNTPRGEPARLVEPKSGDIEEEIRPPAFTVPQEPTENQ